MESLSAVLASMNDIMFSLLRHVSALDQLSLLFKVAEVSKIPASVRLEVDA